MPADPTGCFALCCAAGIVLGFFFHLAELPRRRAFVPILLWDLLFCGLCTLVLTVLALTWNGGELRWFQPLGLLLGIRLYFAGFGVLTRRASNAAQRFAARISCKVKRLSRLVKGKR